VIGVTFPRLGEGAPVMAANGAPQTARRKPVALLSLYDPSSVKAVTSNGETRRLSAPLHTPSAM